MTPQEEIQAALTTLEARKAASTAPEYPWYTGAVYKPTKGCMCMSCEDLVEGYLRVESDHDGPVARDGFYPELKEGDANLIVILRALLDPSIAILRTGLLYWKSGLIYGPGERNALALARSINTTEQKEVSHG